MKSRERSETWELRLAQFLRFIQPLDTEATKKLSKTNQKRAEHWPMTQCWFDIFSFFFRSIATEELTAKSSLNDVSFRRTASEVSIWNSFGNGILWRPWQSPQLVFCLERLWKRKVWKTKQKTAWPRLAPRRRLGSWAQSGSWKGMVRSSIPQITRHCYRCSNPRQKWRLWELGNEIQAWIFWFFRE